MGVVKTNGRVWTGMRGIGGERHPTLAISKRCVTCGLYILVRRVFFTFILKSIVLFGGMIREEEEGHMLLLVGSELTLQT